MPTTIATIHHFQSVKNRRAPRPSPGTLRPRWICHAVRIANIPIAMYMVNVVRVLAIAEAFSWTVLIAGLILRATAGLAIATTIGGAIHGFVFLSYGATAVLVGWRATTIDVDVVFHPEQESVLRALAELKNELQINVELVSPADFLPVPAAWEDRSIFVARKGRLSFYHFDPYAQALAKLERAHARDLGDVRELLERGLVDRERLQSYFAEVEPELFRFPAVDPRSLRSRVEETLAS